MIYIIIGRGIENDTILDIQYSSRGVNCLHPWRLKAKEVVSWKIVKEIVVASANVM